MLTKTQKAYMADAMWAVTDSATDEGTTPKGGFWYALTNPFESYIAGRTVGADAVSVANAHTMYVELFAKGDLVTSDDFKEFVTLAKLVATKDNWAKYNLDERWAALSDAEQGPSEFDLALDKFDIPRPSTWGDTIASLGSWAKWMLLGTAALVAFVVVGRVAR